MEELFDTLAKIFSSLSTQFVGFLFGIAATQLTQTIHKQSEAQKDYICLLCDRLMNIGLPTPNDLVHLKITIADAYFISPRLLPIKQKAYSMLYVYAIKNLSSYDIDRTLALHRLQTYKDTMINQDTYPKIIARKPTRHEIISDANLYFRCFVAMFFIAILWTNTFSEISSLMYLCLFVFLIICSVLTSVIINFIFVGVRVTLEHLGFHG